MKPSATNVRRAEIGLLKRTRTRTSILRAAMEVVGDEDGRFARVDEIMSEAKMARGTFYNYFDSREDLIDVLAYELSHNFNTVVVENVNVEQDAAKRACMGIRYYLHRARLDHKWGWAIVNVSMNSPKLFGEETFNQVNKTITEGMAEGAFQIDRPENGSDLLLGATLTAVIKILQAEPTPDYAEEMTFLILRGLGVSPAKARRFVSIPLPELKPYAAPFGE